MYNTRRIGITADDGPEPGDEQDCGRIYAKFKKYAVPVSALRAILDKERGDKACRSFILSRQDFSSGIEVKQAATSLRAIRR